jgi:trehalose/maltose hydrolase-like predicted phosphorylase
MPGRFDYVKYDTTAQAQQARLRSLFESIDIEIDAHFADGRAKSLALSHLEEAYMWVGKAIRDDQVTRGGDSADRPERG